MEYPKYYKNKSGFQVFKVINEENAILVSTSVGVGIFSNVLWQMQMIKMDAFYKNTIPLLEPSTEAEFTNAARKAIALASKEIDNVGRVSNEFTIDPDFYCKEQDYENGNKCAAQCTRCSGFHT